MTCPECERNPIPPDDFICAQCRLKVNSGGKVPFLCKIGFHSFRPFACRRCGKDPYTK